MGTEGPGAGPVTTPTPEHNFDPPTVASFGEEWTTHDQSRLGEEERREIFDAYFRLFPWSRIDRTSTGFDLGCGSGRWAQLVAPRVGLLHCIDPSDAALAVAKRNLSQLSNCRFHHASVDSIPLPESSMDFGYAIGVLHHLPDPLSGLRSCVSKLKPGGVVLIYVYYAFDNRPWWFKRLWQVADRIRKYVSSLPGARKQFVTDVIATLVYWPAARAALALDILHLNPEVMPLAAYRRRSFYTMRTDARDRFGTPLERRFTSAQVSEMMLDAGLNDIRIANAPPYWCAVGRRAG